MYGRNATVSDDYDEVRLALTDGHTGVRFSIVARAYDACVALRYELETSPVTLDLAAELTTFVLPDGCVVYGSRDEDP
ncbi:MAG TPA: glycoside hydrolase family 97 N-terminal domain-containing protein, partial [Rugosimonospora sp.]